MEKKEECSGRDEKEFQEFCKSENERRKRCREFYAANTKYKIMKSTYQNLMKVTHDDWMDDEF